MTMTKLQENILRYIEVSKDLESLTKVLKTDYPELRVASEIVAMARKSLIEKNLAMRFVKDMPMAKFLSYEFEPRLVNKKA